jgi:hypothetical protein
MKVDPMGQLMQLLMLGTVQIEHTQVPCEYEVTLFTGRHGAHTHHGGATLAEALNRATQATLRTTDAQRGEKP